MLNTNTPYTAFCSPPDKTTVAPAMVAPASVPGEGTTQHLDALGNASHLDALPQLALCNSCLRIRRFASYEAANRSDCLCGAKGVHADSYCACCDHVAELLLAGQRTGLPGIPERFDLSRWMPENGLPVVDFLQAQLPSDSLRCAFLFKFSNPTGFWMLLHPGCQRAGYLSIYSRAARRSAAGGAL